MYLSRLTFNSWDRAVRKTFRDAYHLHGCIMQAFGETKRNESSGILFRHEPVPSEDNWLTVLVQSQTTPYWDILADQLGPVFEYQSKVVVFQLSQGQKLRFRLRANPCISQQGKRKALIGEVAQRAWLEKKAQVNGFALLDYRLQDEGVQQNRKKGQQVLSVYTVLYEGALMITDLEAFYTGIHQGIGPAKSLGCGLLSLSSLR